MTDIHVRIAVTTDAEGIVRTHHEAVWKTARERSVARLTLSSSLNAEAFYAKHRYDVLERAVHRLRSGRMKWRASG